MPGKQKYHKIIFPGTFDPFTFAHFEAFNLATKELNKKISIVIIENRSKKSKIFSFEERKEMISSYLPEAEVVFAKNDKEWQKIWEHTEIAIRKFRGNSDIEEDIATCKKHSIDFNKIRYFKLKKSFNISSLKVKVLSVIEEFPNGINEFTFKKLQEKIPRN